MELKEIRKNIDNIDDKIVALYRERMELCEQVAKEKAKSDKPINDAKREREIIFRLSEQVPKELTLYLKELYETIFFTSKARNIRFKIWIKNFSLNGILYFFRGFISNIRSMARGKDRD